MNPREIIYEFVDGFNHTDRPTDEGAVDRLLGALAESGYVIVPRVPTSHMLNHACPVEDKSGAPYVYDRSVTAELYRATIEAALMENQDTSAK